MRQSPFGKLLNPFTDSLVRTGLILDATGAIDLVWKRDNQKIKKICDQIIQSANWESATDPIKILAYSVRGVASQRLEQLDGAAEDFKETLKLEPSNYLANLYLGDLYRIREQFADAEHFLSLAIEYSAQPNADNYVTRGSILMRLGRNEDALSDFKKASEIDPQNLNALLNSSVICMASKDYLGATIYTSKLINIKPDHGVACLQRASARHAMKDFKGAIEDFSKAIELGEFHKGDSYFGRAISLGQLAQHESALPDFEKAIEHQPDSFKFWLHKGSALTSLKRLDESVIAIRQCLQFAKDADNRVTCHTNLSSAFIKLGDAEAAIIECSRAIEEKPSVCAIAYNNRAFALAHLGRPEEAIADIDEAFRVSNAGKINLTSTRGVVRYLLGRLDEAKADFDSALELQPEIGEAFYFRAAILEKHGHVAEAAADRARAAELDYRHPSFSILQ